MELEEVERCSLCVKSGEKHREIDWCCGSVEEKRKGLIRRSDLELERGWWWIRST